MVEQKLKIVGLHTATEEDKMAALEGSYPLFLSLYLKGECNVECKKCSEHPPEYGDVLTEHVGSAELTETCEEGISEREIYDRDMAWLDEADVLIAEVSIPSLGVGYEISKAVERKIPVLCLYVPKPGGKLSAMLLGAPRIIVKEYMGFEELQKHIIDFLDKSD